VIFAFIPIYLPVVIGMGNKKYIASEHTIFY
jgi:hypothetical protein